MIEPVIAEDAEPVEEAKPKTRRRPKAQKAAEDLGSKPDNLVEQVSAPKPEPEATEKPVPSKTEGPKRRGRAKKVDDTPLFADEAPVAEARVEVAPVEPEAKAPAKARAPAKTKAASRAKPKAAALADNDMAATAEPSGSDGDDDEPRRGGWWNRTFG